MGVDSGLTFDTIIPGIDITNPDGEVVDLITDDI